MALKVLNHISLDGVLQGPGEPDEDRRGDFRHGGWALPGNDEVMAAEVGKVHAGQTGGGLVLGRRSYEGMLGAWNAKGGPFRDALNAAPKYVASSNPSLPLAWPNSELVSGDVPARVAELKARHEGDLLIMGSGGLIRSLVPSGVIDEWVLMIHPLVLGSGIRLFGDHETDVLGLRLVSSVATTTGVIIATYRPA